MYLARGKVQGGHFFADDGYVSDGTRSGYSMYIHTYNIYIDTDGVYVHKYNIITVSISWLAKHIGSHK